MEVRELGISVHLTIPLMGQDKVIISTNAIKKTLVLDLLIENFSYIRLLIRFQIGNFICLRGSYSNDIQLILETCKEIKNKFTHLCMSSALVHNEVHPCRGHRKPTAHPDQLYSANKGAVNSEALYHWETSL